MIPYTPRSSSLVLRGLMPARSGELLLSQSKRAAMASQDLAERRDGLSTSHAYAGRCTTLDYSIVQW